MCSACHFYPVLNKTGLRQRILLQSHTRNFMKICPVGVTLKHADEKDRHVEVCRLQMCLVRHSKYTTEHLFSHQLRQSEYFLFTSELVLLLHASHEHTDNVRMKGHRCLITIHKDSNSRRFWTCNICDLGKTILSTWLWSQTLHKHLLDKPVASHTTTRLNTALHFITALFSFIQNFPQALKEKSAYSEFGIRTVKIRLKSEFQ